MLRIKPKECQLSENRIPTCCCLSFHLPFVSDADRLAFEPLISIKTDPEDDDDDEESKPLKLRLKLVTKGKKRRTVEAKSESQSEDASTATTTSSSEKNFVKGISS